jgi:hypothetical protein
MKIGTNSFRGEAPLVTARELPDNAAQDATNCRLQSGDLESWRQFLLTKTLANAGPVRTVYLLNDKWLSWDAQVDVARGVIPGDSTYRTFLTSPGLYSTPRYTTYALATTGAEPFPVATRPLGVPEPDTAPTLVQGIDTTPTTFSIDVLDEGNNLEAQWVTSPPQTSSTWSTATQDAVIGNPAPSYAIAFEEIHNAIDQPYAFRNFGIAAATLIKVTCEFRFDGDTSCKQALLHVANDVAGSGVLAYYQIGGELASGKLEIRKATAWGLFNSVGVDSVALAALAAGTIYRFEATVLVNSDGTQTVTLALFNGVTQLATVTATNRFTIGDYMGFAGGDPVDLAGPAITHYDNLHVMATGATGLVPEQTATSYVYTFVNSLGEESAPSPTSATVLRPDGVSITVTTPTTTPGGTDPLYNIVEKRIYRAVTGSTGTVFQRVTTIPLATADYVDVLYDSELSKDVLESEDWDLPPPTLQGIIPLPNGIMAGFFGNQLCLSVRLRPHAWPVLYRLPVDTDIVAIANIDNTIVIGTKSFVYTATGNDPGSYSMSQPGSPQACVSKLSMRFLEGIGVVFASPDGYQVCSGSASAVRNATALTFTKRQWESLLPSSIISGVYDGVLYFFFTGTTPDRGYALDVKPNGFGLVRLSFHATAMHTDPLTDSMHLVLDVNSEPTDAALPLASTAVTPNGLRLFQFDAAPDSDMVFRWRGKLNLMPYPITLTIAQVRAASFTNLVAKFYADGVLIKTKTLTGQKEFTIPAKDDHDSYELELIGTNTVRNMQAAEDVMELT